MGDLNQVVRTGFAGEKAGVVYEGEKRYDLVVCQSVIQYLDDPAASGAIRTMAS